MPRVNRAVTSEPWTELRAEPGRAWLQEEQVPTGRLANRRSRAAAAVRPGGPVPTPSRHDGL